MSEERRSCDGALRHDLRYGAFVRFISRFAFTGMEDPPAGEESGEFPAAQKVSRIHGFYIGRVIQHVDDGDDQASRAHAGANCREQIALQVIAIANEIEPIRLNLELMLFEIRYAHLYWHVKITRPLLEDPNRRARGIHRSHLPASRRQQQCMPAGA